MRKILVIMLIISILIISTYSLPTVMASSAPQVAILLPKEGQTYSHNEPVKVVFNVSDADSSTLTYFIAVDRHLLSSGITSTGQLTATIGPFQPGKHTLNITVIDEEHNYDVESVSFNVINSPPSVKVLYPSNNTSTTATHTTLLIYTEDPDNATLSLNITNGNFTASTIVKTGTYTTDIPLNQGINHINVSVSDGYQTASTTITVKQVPTQVKIIFPQEGMMLRTGTINIKGKVYTTTLTIYQLLINGKTVLTGTTAQTIPVIYQVNATQTGTLKINLISQTGSYTASDTVSIHIISKPNVKLIFPRILEKGIATLTVISDMALDNVNIYTDTMAIKTLSRISSGTTTFPVQTQLYANRNIHTIALLSNNEVLASATFTVTGNIPRIYSVGTPTQTQAPTILITPEVDGASTTYVYVENKNIGTPPITYTPPEDGTYTIKINAIGGASFSVWKTGTVTFIWKPIISIKDAYWESGKLNVSIEITDYDKDVDMLTIQPINLYWPIHMTSTTQIFNVEIPETYITIGSTLTIVAHDTSGYTSTLTFTVPGKIPSPRIISPNPETGITVFEDTVQVTVQVDATGTIYWYQDGYLTKKQPAPKVGSYTYMFFVPDVKRYTIYARLCDGTACSPSSQTLIVKKGAFVKLWVGKTMYFANGKVSAMDVSPFIDPRFNRTVVPIRFVGSALGYQIDWNAQTRDVTLQKDDLKIVMNLKVRDKVKIKVNNQVKTVYVGSATVIIQNSGIPSIINLHHFNGQDMGEPIIVDSRTYVPVRFLSEILGAKVSWDPKTKGISILLIP